MILLAGKPRRTSESVSARPAGRRGVKEAGASVGRGALFIRAAQSINFIRVWSHFWKLIELAIFASATLHRLFPSSPVSPHMSIWSKFPVVFDQWESSLQFTYALPAALSPLDAPPLQHNEYLLAVRRSGEWGKRRVKKAAALPAPPPPAPA